MRASEYTQGWVYFIEGVHPALRVGCSKGTAMRASDTSQDAHEFQVRLYRAMTPEQRSELAMRMSDDVRRVTAEGIRQRHPDYSERDVRRALVALLYGRDAAAKVWPGEPVAEP